MFITKIINYFNKSSKAIHPRTEKNFCSEVIIARSEINSKKIDSKKCPSIIIVIFAISLIVFLLYILCEGIFRIFCLKLWGNINGLLAIPFVTVLVVGVIVPLFLRDDSKLKKATKSKSRRIGACIIAILFFLAPPVVQVFLDPDMQLEWGMVLEDKGEYQKAISKYTRAIAASSPYLAYLKRSNCYLLLDEPDKAILDCNEIIDNVDATTSMQLFRNSNQIIEITEIQIRENPYDMDALTTQNEALMLRKKLRAEVRISVEEILYFAYFNRASAYHDTGVFPDAIADYSSALEINPKDEIAYLRRGSVWFLLKMWDEAIADCNEAIQIVSDDYYAKTLMFYVRGQAYRRSGKIEEAMLDYNTVIERTPNSNLDCFVRGWAYIVLEKWDEAITDFSGIIASDSKQFFPYMPRGYAYARISKWQEAIEDYSKAIELNSEDASLYHHRGRIYDELAEFENAIVDYNMAIELNPVYFDAYVDRAFAYLWSGDVENFHADFDKSTELKELYEIE